MGKKSSIESLDCHDEMTPRLSPRSLFACRRLGISPRELRYRPLAEFSSISLNEELAVLRHNHNEERRKLRIGCIIKQKAFKDEGVPSRESLSRSFSHNFSLQRELSEINKLEKRRHQEIQVILESTIREEKRAKMNQEITKRENDILLARRAVAASRLNELSRKQKRREEMKKFLRTQEEERQKQDALQAFNSNRQQSLEGWKKEQDREENSRRRELSRIRQHAEFTKKLHEKQLVSDLETAKRAQLLQKRESEKAKLLAEVACFKQVATEQKRLQSNVKLGLARAKLSELTQEKKEYYQLRQHEYETKNLKIDACKGEAKRQALAKGEQKNKEIQRVLVTNKQAQLSRKQRILEEQRKTEQKHKENQEQLKTEILRRKGARKEQ